MATTSERMSEVRVYRCDTCDAELSLTVAQFQGGGNRARCPHHSKNRAKNTGSPIVGRNPRIGGPKCDCCGAHNPVKSYKLNQRNWRPHYRLLCTPCRTKLEYTPVDFVRAPAAVPTQYHERKAA